MVLPTWPCKWGLDSAQMSGERELSLGSQVWVRTDASLRDAGDPWPLGRGHGGIGRSWGWVQDPAWDPCCNTARPRPQALLLLGPPRWPASPWTSSSCSSTPSGCAAGGAGGEEHLDADCCCTAWCVIIATLVCR